MTVFIVLTAGLLLTATLIGVAPHVGWFDRREGLEYRKPIEENIPVVGGAAILGAIAVGAVFDPTFQLPWPALVTAFLLGLADDVRRGGISPTVKFSGQLLVATLLIVVPGPLLADHTSTELLMIAGFALVAMNAVNLFDHADGMAGTACFVALVPGGPVLAAAVGAYLPFNILFRDKKTFRESVPSTMLGDAGTHLLGVLIAVTPGAFWLMLVPLLDAARVVIARVLRGQPFWVGDRTHLGNRLAALGFGPLSVSLVVAVLMSPPIIAQVVTGEEGISIGSMVVSVFLYLIAVDASKGALAPALETREADLDPLRPAIHKDDDGASEGAEEGDAEPAGAGMQLLGPGLPNEPGGLPALEPTTLDGVPAPAVIQPRRPQLVARRTSHEVPPSVRDMPDVEPRRGRRVERDAEIEVEVETEREAPRRGVPVEVLHPVRSQGRPPRRVDVETVREAEYEVEDADTRVPGSAKHSHPLTGSGPEPESERDAVASPFADLE